MFRSIFFTSVFITVVGTVKGQGPNKDSTVLEKAAYNTLQIYHQFMGDQAGVYNGRRYNDYRYMFSAGNPFLDTTVMSNGSITYNNIFYENVPLLFDVLKEKVIVATPGTYNMVELASSRVAGFSVLNHRFVRLPGDSRHSKMQTGFYEALFQGKKHTLYKKHLKVTREDLSGRRLILSIEDQYRYYIQNGNQFFWIKNKKALINAYPNHRQEIRAFLRKSHFRFKTKTDNQLENLAVFYETLSQH